jgi:CheY-like chemotaxis protein
LIILDLMMPVMDGFQFRAAQIRETRLAEIPVVIMTADGHTDEKRSKIGAQAALKKPADIHTILTVVRDLCRAR